MMDDLAFLIFFAALTVTVLIFYMEHIHDLRVRVTLMEKSAP